MRGAAAQVDDKAKAPPQEQEELFETKVEGDLDAELEEAQAKKPEKKAKVEAKPEEKEELEKLDVSALQQQIEDLKKAEAAARGEADRFQQEAEKERQQREREVMQSRQTAEQSQLEAIETALGAAEAEAKAAEEAIRMSIQSGDVEAQSAAYRRLAKAESNIGRLEDGRAELERHIEQAKEQAKQKAEARKNDPIEALDIPPKAKDWLRDHPDYATDQRKNIKLQALHWDALDEGHRPFSTEYFKFVEIGLGLREAEKPAEEVEVDRPGTRRTPVVSAPVSRDNPGGGTRPSPGRITLTAEEREHARASGVTDAEYAKQKARLMEAKANGHYGER